ncbi:MAG TPA: hypothetical protein DEB46_14685 [Myxococcales bacterium]|nr:hypothetical protein [Myxococcales bacterium]
MAFCGDGIVRSGGEAEACDDGNREDQDGCTSACLIARCGDGIQRADLQPGEEGYEACDDGNEHLNDHCLNDCSLARCGDGEIWVGREECDDGNRIDTDECTNLCQVERCGDGQLREGVELCDDGNREDHDACTNDCQPARCGDGILRLDLAEDDDGFELCDDGNRSDHDDCLNNCQEAVCGDGVVRRDLDADEFGFESCDDGNGSNDDGCLVTCQPARCGDGFVHVGAEQCDEGDNNGGALCRADCTLNWRPPAVGLERCDGRIDGDCWRVCRADANSAWIAANSRGTYDAHRACQSVGYARASSRGGTCGTVCGYCGNIGREHYDGGGGDLSRLRLTVHWRCERN